MKHNTASCSLPNSSATGSDVPAPLPSQYRILSKFSATSLSFCWLIRGSYVPSCSITGLCCSNLFCKLKIKIKWKDRHLYFTMLYITQSVTHQQLGHKTSVVQVLQKIFTIIGKASLFLVLHHTNSKQTHTLTHSIFKNIVVEPIAMEHVYNLNSGSSTPH